MVCLLSKQTILILLFYSAMSMQGLKLIFMFERFTFHLFDNTLSIIAIVSTVSINVMNFNYAYGNFR